MLNSQQLKSLGLRFARALQMTVKTAVLFTTEHKTVERPVQQSFEFLNNLLKEAGQFTFGFVDNQIVLNNLLTTDASLHQLETEFLKRGIAAVTFEPGLTLARYKKIVGLLAAPAKTIEDAGGLLRFLDQNEVEGARVLPAARNQKKDEHGDTIIETDSESYILSKQMAEEQAPRDFLDSIDALLESACFDPAMRTEVLSDFAARGMEGSEYGVPIGMPNLAIVKEGEAVGPAGATGSGTGTQGVAGTGGTGSPTEGAALAAAAGAPGSGSGSANNSANGQPGEGSGESGGPFSSIWSVPGGSASAGFAAPGSDAPRGHHAGGGGLPGGSHGRAGGFSGPPGGGHITGVGFGSGDQAGGGPGLGPGFGSGKGGPWASGSGSFIELVEKSVQRSLLEEKGNPQKSYTSLARILRNMGVDKILGHFPAERREELTSMPPEQLAAEYIEDTALQLAGAKLKEADGAQQVAVEEEVVHVLARSLQATHMADRLAQKLAKFIQDFAVPPHVQEKIREELHWSSLSNSKKYDRLMQTRNYSSIEFRRLMDLLKELVTQREIDSATALASHYFEFLDEKGASIDITDLSRAPELIRSIPLAHLGFAAKTAERLGRTLLREDIPDFIHAQTASAMTVLAQSIVAFEDFQDVLTIGLSLETSNNRNLDKHKKCCGVALSRLLQSAAIERIIELFLKQRGDSAWAKTAATLLRFAAPASIESVFDHLVNEEDAKNRLALLRLVTQLGRGATEVAYKYLADDRWYVVRNVCGVLAELKDPEMSKHIAPALQHPDVRVQQAALTALVKSRGVDVGPVLAASLSKLAPNTLDEALDELMFRKDAGTISGLEEFASTRHGNLASTRKAVQALACIPGDATLHALGRICGKEELDSGVRRLALAAICRSQSPAAREVLEQLAATEGLLADEARTELKKREPKPQA